MNGTTYLPGQALPYSNTTGLGGPSATGGFVLAGPGSPANAEFPYWKLDNLPAAGQLITGYQTTAGGAVTALTVGTTYYFKAWAYDAAKNYGRGLEVSEKLSTDPPIRINEFNSTGDATNGVPLDFSNQDTIEFFNPSGAAATLSGLWISDEETTKAKAIAGSNVIPARSYFTMTANGKNNTGSNLDFKLGAGSDRLLLLSSDKLRTIDDFLYTRDQITTGTTPSLIPSIEGRVWDGGPRGNSFDFDHNVSTDLPPGPRFETAGGLYRSSSGSPHPTTLGAANQTQTQSAAKFIQATRNHVTGTGVFLHYVNLGEEPAVWRYSPKQQDFHPISVEGLALRSQSEIVVGLRSPLTNRTTGNAYAFVFSNAGDVKLPASGWIAPAVGQPAVVGQQGAPRELNLYGQGIRSVQWCPGLRNAADVAGSPATGAYLIVGGSSNGGPLKNETTRQKFSLYRWDNVNVQPVRVVEDLSGFAVRPEGASMS